jgi:hypothetical protein
MFAVFADDTVGNEVTGRGDTPQMAWENMLIDFALDDDDIDPDTVGFYREISVNRETKITWTESNE